MKRFTKIDKRCRKGNGNCYIPGDYVNEYTVCVKCKKPILTGNDKTKGIESQNPEYIFENDNDNNIKICRIIKPNRARTLEGIPSCDLLICKKIGLKSLKGCPESVTMLDCSDNVIETLYYCPPKVTHLDCSNNKIKTLEYIGSNVVRLICSYNYITSLKFSPYGLKILDCSRNKLESLKYASPTLEELYCSYNKIKSSALKYIGGFVWRLDCSNNKIRTMKYCPGTVVAITQ